jgi:hypothetical protein
MDNKAALLRLDRDAALHLKMVPGYAPPSRCPTHPT